jgi:hypothetical protein
MLCLVGFEGIAAAQMPAPGGAAYGGSGASAPAHGDALARGASLTARRRAALARGEAGKTRRRTRTRAGRRITVPVELSVGPAAFAFGNLFTNGKAFGGALYEDQPVHYGLRINIAAIIDYEFVRKHPRLVPRKYRRMFKPGSEVRITPGILALIPRDIIISPKLNRTGVYGATWELLGVGVDLFESSTSNLSVDAGLLATYAYIDSDLYDSATHFLRPGVSLGLSAGTMLSDSFGLSAGWNSNLYIPQKLGGGVFEMGEGADSLWHIGEAFVMLRFRFPYTTTM